VLCVTVLNMNVPVPDSNQTGDDWRLPLPLLKNALFCTANVPPLVWSAPDVFENSDAASIVSAHRLSTPTAAVFWRMVAPWMPSVAPASHDTPPVPLRIVT